MGARPRLTTELDTRPGRHAIVSGGDRGRGHGAPGAGAPLDAVQHSRNGHAARAGRDTDWPSAGIELRPEHFRTGTALPRSRTPPGPKYPYRFQVFALDRTLPAASIDTFTTLLELAKGHVLASGELVGLGSADAK